MIAFIIRLFLLTVIILMVYPVLRRLLAASTPARPRTTAVHYEPMVRCAHCGVHLPRSGVIERHGQTYCSAEHAAQGEREGRPG
jgi:uncharacterized protein